MFTPMNIVPHVFLKVGITPQDSYNAACLWIVKVAKAALTPQVYMEHQVISRAGQPLEGGVFLHKLRCGPVSAFR